VPRAPPRHRLGSDSPVNVIIELAGFRATFALMGRDPSEPPGWPTRSAHGVMQEPDDEDDDEDEDDQTELPTNTTD
jgi:hypothetical protein